MGTVRFGLAAGQLRCRFVPALMLAFLAIVLLTSSASAAEFRTGDSPHVDAGETVTGDLYLFGGDVDIDGTVAGDAIVSAGRLTLDGRVQGSLSVLAGDVEIEGEVTRSIRVVGGDVSIDGDIGGDVVVVGGSVTIASTATVAGDLVVTGGDADVLGPVTGDIRGNVGSLTVSSTVGGNVRVNADEIRLRGGARVAGDFRYTSRNEAQRDDGARVTGTTRHTHRTRFYPGDNLTSWFLSAIFRLLCALVAGATLVLFLPRAATAAADSIRRVPLRAFLLGFAFLFLIPVIVVILAITVVGIPIALILAASYLCILYLSQVVLGLALGRIVLPKSWDSASRGYNLLAMTLGVLVIAGLRLIPVPFLGTVIASLTAIVGLGAVLVALRRSRTTPAAFPSY